MNGIIRNQIYLNSTEFDLLDFKPSIAFVPYFESNAKFVYFLELNYSREEGYNRNIQLFYFEDSFANIYEIIDTSDNNTSLVQTAVDSLSKELKIIGIFTQFSSYDHRVFGDGNGLIIIIQDATTIRYCIFQINSLNYNNMV